MDRDILYVGAYGDYHRAHEFMQRCTIVEGGAWFAWHPVKIGDRWAWFERIQRRRDFNFFTMWRSPWRYSLT